MTIFYDVSNTVVIVGGILVKVSYNFTCLSPFVHRHCFNFKFVLVMICSHASIDLNLFFKKNVQ